MFQRIALSWGLLAITSTCVAQQVRPASSNKIYHEIAQMRHLVNVLYVAAHPDDENTRLLAWLVNEKNIRTGYLSLTRGDGGQNILGSEQGDALGLIRTHELMEARKLDGAEQFFSRAIDFGFSKSYTETFKHWNKNLLVGDAVWVMRSFRPDVVICRFPPNKEAGHGQHAASAIVAMEAFKAAGDRTQYADQLIYHEAWQPKRIFWNTYRFGERNTTAEDQLKITVGDYQPGMGMGTGELAGMSRSVHKSQGAGTPSVPGSLTEYFKLTDGSPVTQSIFDGIDITWGRVGRPDIGIDLKTILNDFDYRHPDASIPALLELRKKIATVQDPYWRRQKMNELDQIIIDCTGLMAEVFTKKQEAVRGETLPFNLQIISRSAATVRLKGINWGNGIDTTMNKKLAIDSLYKLEKSITLPAETPISEPYWLAKQTDDAGSFNIPSLEVLGEPETPNKLNISVKISIKGELFDLSVPLSSKKLDPVKGDVVEALRIVPKVTLAFNSNVLMANTDGTVNAAVRIKSAVAIKDASLMLLHNNLAMLNVPHLNLSANGDTMVYVTLNATKNGLDKENDFKVQAVVTENNGESYRRTQHLIQYSHIPTLQYFTPATAKVIKRNWKTTAKLVGYVEGAGDKVAEVLKDAGVQVELLKENDFADPAKLKKYDAIITGIRAVNVEKKMASWLPILFKYAEGGGTLVMLYNTTQDMATAKLGPFPFTLGGDKRVTEEDAAITILQPNNPIFNTPNKITAVDFNNWVQERGLYFAAKWDEKYTPLLSMHDEGEDDLKGGTLYTPFGKGHYLYTSLSFSRQLPAGNLGAIRLLMNMISLSK
jgi:LmbE family N-acetylglucosaminyl deacetylase/flavodoxin